MSIINNIKKSLINENEYLVGDTKVKVTTNINGIIHLIASVPIEEELKVAALKIIDEINIEPSFGLFKIQDGFLYTFICVLDEGISKDELIDALISDLNTTLSVIEIRKGLEYGE